MLVASRKALVSFHAPAALNVWKRCLEAIPHVHATNIAEIFVPTSHPRGVSRGLQQGGEDQDLGDEFCCFFDHEHRDLITLCFAGGLV